MPSIPDHGAGAARGPPITLNIHSLTVCVACLVQSSIKALLADVQAQLALIDAAER